MTPRYAELCKVILREVKRQVRAQRGDIPVDCSHYEFKKTTGLLSDKIRFDGHAPYGFWRMR
jgi:hypothetical protein